MAFHSDGTGIGFYANRVENGLENRCLKAVHQNCAVIRSREYRQWETPSGHPGGGAGAQPLPHNPRKQRKNPAAAGGENGFVRASGGGNATAVEPSPL